MHDNQELVALPPDSSCFSSMTDNRYIFSGMTLKDYWCVGDMDPADEP
jgi:hypothetical protein